MSDQRLLRNRPTFDFETHKAYKLAMDFMLLVPRVKVAANDRTIFNHRRSRV